MPNFNEYTQHGQKQPPLRKSHLIQWLCRHAIALGLRIPLLSTLLLESFPTMCVYIDLLHQRGEYGRLHALIVRLLKTKWYNTPEKSNHWWFLMHLIIAFLQERQIRSLLIFPDLEEELILLGQQGPGPREGYHIAYRHVGFSLWLFERGVVRDAIQMVEIAAKADPHWGYPEYLIGWYGLFSEGVDCVEHFSKAALLDWNFLHRLKRDRTCQQFPEIVRKVHQKVLIQDQNPKDRRSQD